ncbi:hypothetical protein LTR94_030863, partial [Friedmanniomyces endolithicus]
MTLLARLDRQVESAPDADVRAARLVAQEFDAFLDLVDRDGGPAQAGLFIARRSVGLGDLLDAAGEDTAPAHDLAPLAGLRGGGLALPAPVAGAWSVDSHAAERLVSRLFATLLGMVAPGEMLDVAVAAQGDRLALSIARPAALVDRDEAALLALDDEDAGEDEGAPLLGAGFALRLARNLAAELGGRLMFGAD